MNDREDEIDRTEKISYRKDSISANTNSQIAYYKTSVHMYSIYYIQGSYAAWKSLNSMEFHLFKIKALKAWNFIN